MLAEAGVHKYGKKAGKSGLIGATVRYCGRLDNFVRFFNFLYYPDYILIGLPDCFNDIGI